MKKHSKKKERLTSKLAKQMDEGRKLDEEIKRNLEILGWKME